MTTRDEIVERSIALVGQIMQYLLEHPDVLNALPDDFELVVLPKDDPEMRAYNLELLDRFSDQGKPIVFARTLPKKGRAFPQPVFFAPIVPAAG